MTVGATQHEESGGGTRSNADAIEVIPPFDNLDDTVALHRVDQEEDGA